MPLECKYCNATAVVWFPLVPQITLVLGFTKTLACTVQSRLQWIHG